MEGSEERREEEAMGSGMYLPKGIKSFFLESFDLLKLGYIGRNDEYVAFPGDLGDLLSGCFQCFQIHIGENNLETIPIEKKKGKTVDEQALILSSGAMNEEDGAKSEKGPRTYSANCLAAANPIPLAAPRTSKTSATSLHYTNNETRTHQ